MPTYPFRSTALAVALVTAVGLVACERDEERKSVPTRPRVDADQRKGSDVATDARPGALKTTDTARSAASDQHITAGVKTRLAGDSQLGALDIRVETTRGRVMLRGIAPDTGVRRHAAELARGVAGVVDVRNDLSVQLASQ